MHVTLSGGNPMIHKGLEHLIDTLHQYSFAVSVETQGTIFNLEVAQALDSATISPKPPSSGNTTDLMHPALVEWVEFAHGPQGLDLCLKPVVFDQVDYEYAKALHQVYPHTPMYLQAGTLVGEATRDDLCEALEQLQAQVCADPHMQDVAVLPQLHAILKGHARGI
jgi:7-carboxy-7-deazaguanine synthase